MSQSQVRIHIVIDNVNGDVHRVARLIFRFIFRPRATRPIHNADVTQRLGLVPLLTPRLI